MECGERGEWGDIKLRGTSPASNKHLYIYMKKFSSKTNSSV